MHEKPKLQCTRDYGMFRTHQHNRPQHDDSRLFDSMKRHGFMPSSPIQCQRTSDDNLTVIRGHHRLECAKRLGLPVWYVVDESNTDIFDLEAGKQAWSVNDFAGARAQSGDVNCLKVLEFQRAHRLTLGAAISLVGGESAGSNNKIRSIKNGTFRASEDMTHALRVVAITDRCRESGVAFATASAFVSAVSLVVRVPEFESEVLLHRVSLNGASMTRRSTVDAYLKELEAIYNYAAKEKRIPLAYRAREIAKARQGNFGGNRPSTKTRPVPPMRIAAAK